MNEHTKSWESGAIEATEAWFLAHKEYKTHQQFFPFDSEDDIKETIEEEMPFLEHEMQCTVVQLVHTKCRKEKSIVLIGVLGTMIHFNVFPKPN